MTPKADLEIRARQFWAENASEYDHNDHGPEHIVALNILSDHIAKYDWKNLLDVGCGTGHALNLLHGRHPDLRTTGVEPIHEMLLQAQHRQGLGSLVQASGDRLPFADQSFDVVTEFAVLHHLRKPELMVAEMLRVARCAVFLSDTNRYGNGRPPLRLIKLTAAALGVWPVMFWVNTRGRGYYESDGDGISYSYSVFDSAQTCSRWGRTSIVATQPPRHPRPLLGASHALLVAIRT